MPKRNRRKIPEAPSVELPHAFRERLKALLGDEFEQLKAALAVPAPISIRSNTGKPGGPEGDPVPWCNTGRYLKERPIFTLDPLLHAGAYYVQEASSMVLEKALLATGMLDQPILALDLCAAPGGKSTLMRSLLHPDSLLVANEVEGRRRSALQENLWKWGLPNVVVTGSDPSDLHGLPRSFDLILVDAPCSGEGLFRKDPHARMQWSEALVAQCATVQRNIVDQAWEALRPGGVLIYSTCTWETTENEERMQQLAALGALPIALDLAQEQGFVHTSVDGLVGYRCYPHRVRGEGLFIALVRKPNGTEHVAPRPVPASGDPAVRGWLRDPERWALTRKGDTLFAVSSCWSAGLHELQRHLRVHSPGKPVAELHAKAWRPHPALALDTELDRDAFSEVALDKPMALRYLHGETLPAQEAQGLALAVFDGHPIGWLNGAGKRWNNLWPSAWRIRMRTP